MTKIVAEYDYTDAELLALFREALVKLSTGGQAYRVGSREFTRADLSEIRETISWLEGRVNAASGIASNVAQRSRPS